MNLSSFFSGISLLIGPAVTLADDVAQATGNQKLQAVSGALVKIGAAFQGVETTAESILPIVVSEFADLKHSLEAAVAAAKAPAAAVAAAPTSGQAVSA